MGFLQGFLTFVVLGVIFGSGVIWFIQLLIWKTAYKTAKRKGISTDYCMWLLVPCIGIAVAYWIACAEEKPCSTV